MSRAAEITAEAHVSAMALTAPGKYEYEIEALLHAGHTPALMCAEQRPEVCHRYWMLTPPLVERGIEVLHIDETGGLKTDLTTQDRLL